MSLDVHNKHVWCERCCEYVRPVYRHNGDWRYFYACPKCLTKFAYYSDRQLLDRSPSGCEDA